MYMLLEKITNQPNKQTNKQTNIILTEEVTTSIYFFQSTKTNSTFPN